MLEALKEAVCQANKELAIQDLVTHTWGNVSGICREQGLVVIKPSGVAYEDLRPEDMVVLDMDGNVVEGDLRPSSDTPTHLVLYRYFPQLGGIVHTHSPYATAWAQARMDIPCYGTTHADYFRGAVPCCRELTEAEIRGDYEANTGLVILETFRNLQLDPVHMPAALCASHGCFTWGQDPQQAVYHAVVLEDVAKMGFLTRQLRPDTAPAAQSIQDKHFLRKHGPNAYYGQK